jgi:hypothetical protein
MSILLNSFSDYVAYLQAQFAASTNWSDQQTAALTTLLSDAFGDVAETDNYAISFAAREAFIRLARRESSVLEGARFLGVPIARKSGAETKATMTNAGASSISLSSYEPFTVNGVQAYTKTGYVFQSMETKAVTLFTGTLNTISMSLAGIGEYFSVVLQQPNFQVDQDITVWTQDAKGNKTYYSQFDSAIFLADQGAYLFVPTTLPDGDVMITFGSALFGTVPDSTQTLYVRYALTQGISENNDQTNLNVNSINYPNLRGLTTEPIAGASDVKDMDYYRLCAPILGPTKRKLTRLDEWEAAISGYAGVSDCSVMSQKDIAPNDPSWMGVVRVCVLPSTSLTWGGVNPNPTSAVWETFRRWLEMYKSPLTVQTWNPERILADVEVNVTVTDDVNIQDMYAVLYPAITSVFKRKRGTLGRRLARQDIADAIKFDGDSRRLGIDYIDLITPTTDIIPSSKTQWVDIRNLKLNISYSER